MSANIGNKNTVTRHKAWLSVGLIGLAVTLVLMLVAVALDRRLDGFYAVLPVWIMFSIMGLVSARPLSCARRVENWLHRPEPRR